MATDGISAYKRICTRSGFTLIELLVVVAIISLLLGILLPSLSAARRVAMAVKCGANLKDIGTAMQSYLADAEGVFPPAYIYPNGPDGNYDYYTQDASHPYGYIHWSWYLYNRGTVDARTFSCPGADNGGTPRTNPGPAGPWEGGQIDQNGSGPPGNLEDRQAPRLSYGGNAAVFPRNKFTTDLSGGERVNIFVNESKLGDISKTILIAEYGKNWKVTATGEGGGLTSKSHRSINPFVHLGSGADEYSAALDTPGFTYGNPPYYGLMPKKVVESSSGMIDTAGIAETNAVGRFHAGNTDAYIGGTANFMYVDGHVERKSVLDTVRNWEWGTRYYSISGNNKVGPPF